MGILDLIADFAMWVVEQFGYWGILAAMFLESACIPIPSEVVMPFSGFAVTLGKLSFWPVVLVGTIGQLLGSTAVYFIGRSGGRSVLERYGKYVLISNKDISTADDWFNRYGELTVFFSRIMPVVRTFISLPAGIAQMNFAKFIAYSTLGVIPWTILLTYAGIKLGQNWESIRSVFHGLDIVIAAAAVIVVALYVWMHVRHFNSSEAD